MQYTDSQSSDELPTSLSVSRSHAEAWECREMISRSLSCRCVTRLQPGNEDKYYSSDGRKVNEEVFVPPGLMLSIYHFQIKLIIEFIYYLIILSNFDTVLLPARTSTK